MDTGGTAEENRCIECPCKRGDWMIRSAVRAVFVTFAIFVLLVLSMAVARAQDTTGTILGTITDASGAVLPGVTVSVKNTDTSQSRTIVTDDGGRYRVPLLAPGHY